MQLTQVRFVVDTEVSGAVTDGMLDMLTADLASHVKAAVFTGALVTASWNVSPKNIDGLDGG